MPLRVPYQNPGESSFPKREFYAMRGVMTIEERLRNILSKIIRVPEARIKPNAHVMDELGADSLQFLEYVRTVEKELGITLKGSESDHFATITKASALLTKRLAAEPAKASAAPTSPAVATPAASAQPGLWLDAEGYLHTPLQIGMPLTGRNGVGESPLLKVLGDLRWTHVGLFSGVPSKLLSDDTGERLYATFFYVEACFSEAKPLADYGENDEFHVISSLKSYGGSVLDGHHWLLPKGATSPPQDAIKEGVPYFRTSNIFVKMLQGAQWLKKSKPAQAGMERIPPMESVPSSAELCKQADTHNQFEAPPAGWVSLSDAPVVVEYDIIPDRDLNGAGLLYFANYPQILDILERQVLQTRAAVTFEESTVDMRTLVKRQSAYLSNACQSDRLRVSVSVYAENPFVPVPNRPAKAEDRPIHLWLNFVMSRCSDDRKMMVSTARKTFTQMTWGQTAALAALGTRIRQS